MGAGEPLEGALESAASLAMSLTSVVISEEILRASDLFINEYIGTMETQVERVRD